MQSIPFTHLPLRPILKSIRANVKLLLVFMQNVPEIIFNIKSYGERISIVFYTIIEFRYLVNLLLSIYLEYNFIAGFIPLPFPVDSGNSFRFKILNEAFFDNVAVHLEFICSVGDFLLTPI